ncbi:ATP-binding cassette domain-containing protein [Lewinella sp. IMCC34191]|uniref:ATP-binding cassette domain-containing protein n=1 Tax=Lewinella sp. IMCC34191 TaxID=2259172 RepID=UPI000E262D50|nr:ATP-binding cassette domain-containing protein [Lewinella sp. IMCC34191]
MTESQSRGELITLSQVKLQFGNLQPLTFQIREGEHWMITGDRATGKTLLAETLAGQRRLSAGVLKYPLLDAKLSPQERYTALRLVTFMDNSRLARNPTNVHYYQQRYNAFDASGHPTVRQYLEAGGFTVEENAELLDIFQIRDLLDREKIKLSSGQTRKVLLARELLRRPRVLIIDNPYVGLDVASRKILNKVLDKLVAALKLTLVLCGHPESVPAAITHRLHLYPDGSSWQGGAGEQPPAPVREVTDQPMLHQLADAWADSTRAEVPEEIIRFRNVTISYGERTILDNLDWQVNRGDKWVVSGANGSGKSTLLSLVYADNPLAYANDISLFGVRRGRGGSIWDIKRRIGFTSPELHTYFRERITAREVILTGYSDTFALGRRYAPEQEKMVSLLLTYFDLDPDANRLFPSLSNGTQRLVLLCRALVKAPPLLLLDEPFQGLDQKSIERARAVLARVTGPADTVVFISHFRQEVPPGMEWLELRLDK